MTEILEKSGNFMRGKKWEPWVLFSVCLSVHILGGVPQSGLGGGTHPRSGQGGTHPRSGWGGYPIPGLARGSPRPGTGYSPRPGMGYPPEPGTGYPPPTWDIASTCYVAGGMPLAFTQEDFLVTFCSTTEHAV